MNTVTGEQLADFVGLNPSTISRAVWTIRDGKGYDLKASVKNYCQMLRRRRGLEETPESELNAELLRWKIQTEKRKDEEWQREKCAQMAEVMLVALSDDISRLREMLADYPQAAEIVGQWKADIDGLQPEDVAEASVDE